MLRTFVDRMRRRQLTVMLSRCTVTRPTGATFDPETRTSTPDAATTVYTGKCSARPTARAGRENEFQGAGVLVESPYVAKLPWDAEEIHVGDILTITAARDPELPGEAFRVASVGYDDWQVARVLGLEDLVDAG